MVFVVSQELCLLVVLARVKFHSARDFGEKAIGLLIGQQCWKGELRAQIIFRWIRVHLWSYVQLAFAMCSVAEFQPHVMGVSSLF